MGRRLKELSERKIWVETIPLRNFIQKIILHTDHRYALFIRKND